MTEHNLTEELAALLNVERAEAGRLLNGLSGAMSAELLQEGKLQLSGLGLFTVHHEPATRQMHGEEAIYCPPRNRVVFLPDLSANTGTLRIASQRMKLGKSDAERFSRALDSLFASSMASGRQIELQGFGMLSKSEGSSYTFHAATGLDELLNSEYQGLREIFLSPDKPPATDEKNSAIEQAAKRANTLRVTLLALMAVSGLLAVVMLMPAIRNSSFFVPAPAPVSLSLSVRQPVALSSADAFRNEGASGDSLAQDKVVVLEKGEFTIVLATFRTAKVALRESAKLKESGIDAFVWPVSDKGKKYYRLALGRYGSGNEAKAGMKSLAQGLARDAALQEITKRYELHGETGL
ncbi:MAG: HU family DNA-binding protein [Chlorobium phaeobacteroides]|jgi:nucleoid DNA-binding protein|nr:HU family DNA-binding protein [Chlorobium phaeobacteroides]